MCRPRRAAVWGTEQFPGIPGNEAAEIGPSCLQALPVAVSPRELKDLPGTALGGGGLGGGRHWKLEKGSALPL